jgi:DNA-binding transcriptional MocR family regulator
MSRPTFIVPEVNLDRDAAVPVQKQIRGRIAAAIRNGSLAKGSKLPSSRMLAKLLQVSRGTVVAAYEEPLVGLRAAVRAAQFPARVQPASDPDGNPLYLNVR